MTWASEPLAPCRLEREFDFLLAVEDVVLRGQIDLWIPKSPENWCWWITKRIGTEGSDYALQLRLYALGSRNVRWPAACRIGPRLCYLRSGRVREVSLAPVDLEAARAVVRELAVAQDRLEFPLKAGEQCHGAAGSTRDCVSRP